MKGAQRRSCVTGLVCATGLGAEQGGPVAVVGSQATCASCVVAGPHDPDLQEAGGVGADLGSARPPSSA